MHKILPRQVDTVVVGTGPSALIASYILHGHIPVYDPNLPHRDPLLHERLRDSTNLLNLDVDRLTEHFSSSRFSYSSQALPVNVLFDALVRPLGETDDIEDTTCIKWLYDPSKAIPHIVVGNAPQSGGQWSSNPVGASWDIGTLSYASMISLPGYSFNAFYCERYNEPMPSYLRPSRRDVAEYFAIYPSKVGIDQAIFSNTEFGGIKRKDQGFHIGSHDIFCNHLILATGTFTNLILPRSLLQPLLELPDRTIQTPEEPILVIGSGFSAADVIITTPPHRKIIHVFKWAPSVAPSPLRACHSNAYPEYASIYRKMKASTLQQARDKKEGRPLVPRSASSSFELSRDWAETYEGFPNTMITAVQMIREENAAIVTFKAKSGEVFTRRVGSLAYVVGRKGSLSYLDRELQNEICPAYDADLGVSGRDMRDAANEDLEISSNVFIIGSLTGDTLIRFSYGSCVYAAGKIMERHNQLQQSKKSKVPVTIYDKAEANGGKSASSSQTQSRKSSGQSAGKNSPRRDYIKIMSGLDGHDLGLQSTQPNVKIRNSYHDRRRILS